MNQSNFAYADMVVFPPRYEINEKKNEMKEKIEGKRKKRNKNNL